MNESKVNDTKHYVQANIKNFKLGNVSTRKTFWLMKEALKSLSQ